MSASSPEGYEQAALGAALVVARKGQLDAVRSVLTSGTLYEYAARHPDWGETRCSL